MYSATQLPCSHRFCKSCICEYFKSKEIKLCPLCRTKLPEEHKYIEDEDFMDLIKSMYPNEYKDKEAKVLAAWEEQRRFVDVVFTIGNY